ncbi:MAG: molecular chaperone HtpG [Ardenticatenaceae bacterium]
MSETETQTQAETQMETETETQAETQAETQTPEPAGQSFEFRAEIQQLLNILVHSLYTDREIFIRELISNASDAINRVQFEMLTRQADEVVDADAELAIDIMTDEDAGTLTISDSGIGMTQEEMIENLGTIARSGAANFLKALQEQPGEAREIIGRFGVGFYSVFMVADKVEVVSRSYLSEAEAVRWISTGGDTYEISPADKEERGTDIIVHLNEEGKEFLQSWRLESIIKKHSGFVAFPIYVDEKRANQQEALWRKRPSDVEEEEYKAFYKQLTMDNQEPLTHIHLSSEAPYDLHAILYIPANREHTFMRLRQEEGIKLYSRKVLIQEYNKDLLPNYFRFVDGVVDSQDLPLNISRETVQSNKVMRQLQRSLTGRVRKTLERMAKNDAETYNKFWEAFGVFIKEGVATEFTDREKLAKLLRFHSTETEGDELTSLTVYKEGMNEDQEEIYYVLGNELASARRSPHLDPFRARDIEVLLMTDPVDGFVVTNLREFDGTRLRNADDPDLELPPLEEDEEEEAQTKTPDDHFAALIMRTKELLDEKIEAVVESKRLTNSPVRLASIDKSGMHEMDRLRRLMGDQDVNEIPKRRFELNRNHSLVRNLAALSVQADENKETASLVNTGIEQLYESALLMEGLHPNPTDMVPRIQQLLEWALRSANAE